MDAKEMANLLTGLWTMAMGVIWLLISVGLLLLLAKYV